MEVRGGLGSPLDRMCSYTYVLEGYRLTGTIVGMRDIYDSSLGFCCTTASGLKKRKTPVRVVGEGKEDLLTSASSSGRAVRIISSTSSCANSAQRSF